MGMVDGASSGLRWHMALQYQKRKALTKNTTANVSKSGVSLSRRAGPVTVNTRGRSSVRLAPGFSYRLNKNQTGVMAVVMLALSLVALLAWLAWAVVRLAWLAIVLPTRWAIGRAWGARKGLAPRREE